MDFEGRGKSPLTGQKRLGPYFVRPGRPSERGANEHANGIIRRRFPKGTGFAAIAGEQVQKVPV
jgi:IS30 family transposase